MMAAGIQRYGPTSSEPARKPAGNASIMSVRPINSGDIFASGKMLVLSALINVLYP